MSFWPFTNALHSNNVLQKFIDSIQDFSTVNVDDFLTDPLLSQELLNELNNIKGNYNSKSGSNFQFSQLNSNESTNQDSSNKTSGDNVSLGSSTNEASNTGSKESKGTKLIELLIQPHILSGLIEYLTKSVDFFHEQNLKESENLEKLLNEENQDTQIEVDDVDVLDDMEDKKEEEEEEEEETADEKFRRCVQSASDILSIDLWIISNRIIETPAIMTKLWSILKLDHLEESSPTVAFLVRILDQLMDTNSIELLNFIRRQRELVDTFLTKIEVPMLMDFFFRVIQTDKADSPTGILETIASQDIIIKLIEILKPQPSQFTHEYNIPNHNLFFKQTAATDFLKALVTISSNAALAVVLETNIGPNQLTRELVSPQIINSMISEIMLVKVKDENGKMQTNKHGINNCVSIIIELIRKNNSDYDLNCGSYSSLLQNGEGGAGGGGPGEINAYVMFQWLKDFEQNPPGPRDPIYLGDMLSIFSDNLPKFQELVKLDPIPPQNVKTEILGFTRFKISELVAELLHCSNMILLNSKKIRKIISIRDHVRLQRHKRLKKALDDPIDFPETPDMDMHDVTTSLDDVSLDDIHFESVSPEEQPLSSDYKKLIESLETADDSEDEEPSISPENPFVCVERDSAIRLNPCVGDYFKIKLIDSNILLEIVTMFTKYPWNNFFHNVVFDLIQQIFNGKLNSYNSFLIVELFKENKCDLTDLIVTAYKQESQPRPGYMGHLILVSEEVVKFTSLYKPDLISPIIVKAIQSEGWTWFINDVLLKTREVYNVILGAEQEEEEDDDEGREYGFDSSIVGYLDMNDQPTKKQAIILGDSSNHDDFIREEQQEEEQEDDVMGIPEIEDTKDSNSEKENQASPDTYRENDFLDNLSDSSSSDEEEAEEDNELRRVPKHSH
ncbi:SIT4-associating protein [Spathaspora sp. JA1]|nr:SIT4-associating protein [Spathaspora sp. JA1]